MESILYVSISLIIGVVIGWLSSKAVTTSANQMEKDLGRERYSELEKTFVGYQATSTSQIKTLDRDLNERNTEIESLKLAAKAASSELGLLNNQLSTAKAENGAANQIIAERTITLEDIQVELKKIKIDHSIVSQHLATAKAINEALVEKLRTQKDEMEELGEKFNLEFENIANKILETKSEKFTELNKSNLNNILEPLGKNITEFKIKVEEVYDKESKERFSLEEKVKELAQLNKIISEEAHNLTKALKNESKTQGGWGEMILENILERSGLVKDREYFIEHQLLDEKGFPMRSDNEDKKMRPDAVIKYPDNRNVIIDSKVSLNAFIRCVEAIDEQTRLNELSDHILCIKKHINSLSAKGYDDYDKSLDFVMMFIPSEPAYIAALQGDPDLWNFAYDKRILLLSPTNLITSLKLIADLWKREYQNQNALEIAERGAKLYDKFVGFVTNLDCVGEHLGKAQDKFDDAYKQLTTGNDNLVAQAIKLKGLGLKTKKELPKEMASASMIVKVE